MEKGDFRGVADGMEHGFTSEKAADSYPVDAANETFSLPALDAMRMALGMKLGIAFDKFRTYPCAPASSRRRGAALHHLTKGAVNRDLKRIFANDFGKAM